MNKKIIKINYQSEPHLLTGGGPYIRMNENMFQNFCNLGDSECAAISLNWLGFSKDIIKQIRRTSMRKDGLKFVHFKDTLNREQNRIRKYDKYRIETDYGPIIHETVPVYKNIKKIFNLVFKDKLLKQGYAYVFGFWSDDDQVGHLTIAAISDSNTYYIIDPQSHSIYRGRKQVESYLRSRKISYLHLFKNGLVLSSPPNPSPIK